VLPSTPTANPQSETRRIFELALQVGHKDALTPFLAQHPEGFYASLAKLQLAKNAAEEDARCGDRERPASRTGASAARPPKAHKRRDQEKAAADAKAAEERRRRRRKRPNSGAGASRRGRTAADPADTPQPANLRESKMAAADAFRGRA